MDADYGVRYRELFERHWWWRAREAVVLRLLRELAPPGGFGDILDIGCGDALFFDELRQFGTPYGLEAEAALVTDRGRAKGDIAVTPFDANFQPGRRFGLILMLDVLEHLDDDVAALRHAADLLEPGGALLLTVPAFNQLWTAHDDYNQHKIRYTGKTFDRAAREAGVQVEKRRYYFQWLFPLKLAVRLKEALLPGKPEMASVPAGPVNAAFHAMCRLEQLTWGRIPLPLGSSMWAICRRD